jgi:hypothetical protein
MTVRIGQYVPSVIAPLPDVHRPGTGGAARIRHRGRERIVLNPYRPGFPGEAAFSGKLSHVADYRSPAPYAGRRVIVVGGGDSADQVAVPTCCLALTSGPSRIADIVGYRRMRSQMRSHQNPRSAVKDGR